MNVADRAAIRRAGADELRATIRRILDRQDAEKAAREAQIPGGPYRPGAWDRAYERHLDRLWPGQRAAASREEV